SRGAPGFFAPGWICLSRKAPRQSTTAARSRSPCSFDVLYLFAQFFDLRLDLQGQSGNRQGLAFHAGRFGKHGVGFAMHFLQKKIELLAELARTVQQLCELLEVAA